MDQNEKSGLLVNEDTSDNYQMGSGMPSYSENNVGSKLNDKTSIRHQFNANAVMFIYFAAYFPMIAVTEQYIYSELSDEYNFHPAVSDVNGTSCDLNETEKSLQKQVQSESSLWMIALKVKINYGCSSYNIRYISISEKNLAYH